MIRSDSGWTHARASVLVALVVIASVSVALTGVAQDHAPMFKASVDLISVDVQVVNKDGSPVTGLRPDQFEVLIDGKGRKVVSAELQQFELPAALHAPTAGPAPSAAPSQAPATVADAGRIYILALDSMSFRPTALVPAREAARKFVETLQPGDLVGLLAFPDGPVVDVTADRSTVLRAIDRVVGHASASLSEYDLTPSEIIDATALPASASALADVQKHDAALAMRLAQLCATSRNPDACRNGAAVIEARMTARFDEMAAFRRVRSLQTALKSLAGSPRRKVVALLSAGMLATDRVGGAPEVGDVERLVGQAAAEANAVIYAIFFDQRTDTISASTRGSVRPTSLRDSTVVSNVLNRVAERSGGTMFNVVQGSGAFAFARILQETSAHYLLGVVPAGTDRDGRAHQIRVKVSQPNVVVRGRSWVALPSATSRSEVAPPLTTSRVNAAAPATLEPLPENVRRLADLYERQQYDAFQATLPATSNLADFIRTYREADPAWPEAPQRERTFALELALTALFSGNGFARDEGAKLLIDTQLAIERAVDEGDFACRWYSTEAAALSGLNAPDVSLPFVARAARHCAAEPRLELARAVILEQQWRQRPDSARAREAIDAYDEIDAGSPEGIEAVVRKAWLSHTAARDRNALAGIPKTIAPSADPAIRYLHGLVNGHLLRDGGHPDAAIRAYREALEAWPDAQSARVALMTLLLNQGAVGEAGELAETIQTANKRETDPWWVYSSGSFRDYPALIAALREVKP